MGVRADNWGMMLPRMVVISLLLSTGAGTQELIPGIEFVNERLRIPESTRFDEGNYIESGVGLSFGVDKRLTYFVGEYEEAAQRFEISVRQFRYKAEIWVYLARAYFYTKSSDVARMPTVAVESSAIDALERAEVLMPDLAGTLWQPLLASLQWEIRRRVVQQQAQIDFYSTGREEVLTLFRLYLFLKDHSAASDLLAVSHERARMMHERAKMVSGASRSAQAAEGDRWDQLGDRLAGELRTAGIDVPPVSSSAPPPEPAVTENVDEQERIRILQLRVDFYRAQQEDYLQLFQTYLDRADITRARSVLASLGRHIGDLDVLSSVAPTLRDQADIEEKIEEFKVLRNDLRNQIPGDDGSL